MLTYDLKLGKSVRVYQGITAVLHRDIPGPYMRCENGASIRNLKPLAIFVAVQLGLCQLWLETPMTEFLTTRLDRHLH